MTNSYILMEIVGIKKTSIMGFKGFGEKIFLLRANDRVEMGMTEM